MGPYHITLRLGVINFSDAAETPKTGEPFLDPVARRLEIAVSPVASIKYPTVNQNGGLGVGYNVPVEPQYSIKGIGRAGMAMGTVSFVSYGAALYPNTGVYFELVDNIPGVSVAANGSKILHIRHNEIRAYRNFYVEGNAEVLGNVIADDFILRRVNRAFQLLGVGTLKDIFVYDTRQDSDGGAWRERTAHTSWHNESPSENRSPRKKFPAIAIIAITSELMVIYDGDDVTLPIWMRIIRGTNRHVTGVMNAVTAFNGSVYVGTDNGMFQIDFIKDFTMRTSTDGRYQTSSPLSDRNLNGTDFIRLAQFGVNYFLPSNNVQGISVNYSSQLTPNRGGTVPEPAVDMVFPNGAVRMNSNRTIFDMSASTSSDYRSMYTSPRGDAYAYNYTGNSVEVLRAHQANSTFNLGQIHKYIPFEATPRGIGLPLAASESRAAFSTMAEDGTLAVGMIGTQNGSTVPMLAYIDEDRTLPTEGMVSIIGTNWLMPWCIGDIKGAWLCNNKTLNRVPRASGLTEVGNVNAEHENNNDIARYFGFSASNYFTAPFNASHMTIPNGDWSFVWHQNLPFTTDRQVIFEIASSDYNENYLRLEVEAGTSFAVFRYNVHPYQIEIKSDRPIDFAENVIMILSKRGRWITLQVGDSTIFSVNLSSPQYNVDPNADLSLANPSAQLVIGRARNAPEYPFQGYLSMFRFSWSAPSYRQVKKIVEWETDLLRKPSIRRLLGASPTQVRDIDGDEFSGKLALSTNYGVYIYSKFVRESHFLEVATPIGSNSVIKSSLRGGKMAVMSGTADIWIDLPEYKVRENMNPASGIKRYMTFEANVGGSYDEFASGTATITRTVVAVIDTPVDVEVIVEVTPHPVVTPDPPPPTPPAQPPAVSKFILFSGDNFNGTATEFTETNVPKIDVFRQRDGFNWNDLAGSIRIIEGTWMFYEHADYRGRALRLWPGDWPRSVLQAHNLYKAISSFRLESGPTAATQAAAGGTFEGTIPIGTIIGLPGTIGLDTEALLNAIGNSNELLGVGYTVNPSNGTTEIYVQHPADVPSTVDVYVAPSGSGGRNVYSDAVVRNEF